MQLRSNKNKSFLNWLYIRSIDIKVKLIDMGQVLHTCNFCSHYICRCSSLDIFGFSLNWLINRQNLIWVDYNSSGMNMNITLAEVPVISETSDAHYTSTDAYEKIFG